MNKYFVLIVIGLCCNQMAFSAVAASKKPELVAIDALGLCPEEARILWDEKRHLVSRIVKLSPEQLSAAQFLQINLASIENNWDETLEFINQVARAQKDQQASAEVPQAAAAPAVSQFDLLSADQVADAAMDARIMSMLAGMQPPVLPGMEDDEFTQEQDEEFMRDLEEASSKRRRLDPNTGAPDPKRKK